MTQVNPVNEPVTPQPQLEDGLNLDDIMGYVAILLKNWKLIFKWGCIGVAVGLVFAFSVVKTYQVDAVLAPEIPQKTGASGSLSSLASLAGVNLNGMQMTDAVYPDLYPQIISSIPFNVDLLSMPLEVEVKDEIISTDLYTYLTEYGHTTWYKWVLSAPMKGLSWFIGLFKDEEEEGDGSIDPEHLTREQTKLIEALGENITLSVDKKTYLISLSVKMQDPFVAKQVCDQVIESLVSYVTQYRTEKARHDAEYYQTLTDESREEYYAVQKKYAEYSDANHGVTRNSYLIESQRLQNETNLAFQLYNQTSQQLQAAKARVQMETPVCVVVQPTTVPVKGDPSRAKVLIIWTFLFVVGICAWVLFGGQATDLYKNIMSKIKE